MEGEVSKCLSSTSITSIVSRLDRLDTMMQHLASKTNSSRWASTSSSTDEDMKTEKKLVPMDVAVKEVQFKGSILERIKSLEDRLVQLFLYIENDSASPSTSSCQLEDSSPHISSSRKFRSRMGLSSSFSKFRTSRHRDEQPAQVCIDKFEDKEPKEHQQKPKKQGEASPGSKSKKMEERGSPKLKKIVPSSWPHLRFLGC